MSNTDLMDGTIKLSLHDYQDLFYLAKVNLAKLREADVNKAEISQKLPHVFGVKRKSVTELDDEDAEFVRQRLRSKAQKREQDARAAGIISDDPEDGSNVEQLKKLAENIPQLKSKDDEFYQRLAESENSYGLLLDYIANENEANELNQTLDYLDLLPLNDFKPDGEEDLLGRTKVNPRLPTSGEGSRSRAVVAGIREPVTFEPPRRKAAAEVVPFSLEQFSEEVINQSARGELLIKKVQEQGLGKAGVKIVIVEEDGQTTPVKVSKPEDSEKKPETVKMNDEAALAATKDELAKALNIPLAQLMFLGNLKRPVASPAEIPAEYQAVALKTNPREIRQSGETLSQIAGYIAVIEGQNIAEFKAKVEEYNDAVTALLLQVPQIDEKYNRVEQDTAENVATKSSLDGLKSIKQMLEIAKARLETTTDNVAKLIQPKSTSTLFEMMRGVTEWCAGAETRLKMLQNQYQQQVNATEAAIKTEPGLDLSVTGGTEAGALATMEYGSDGFEKERFDGVTEKGTNPNKMPTKQETDFFKFSGKRPDYLKWRNSFRPTFNAKRMSLHILYITILNCMPEKVDGFSGNFKEYFRKNFEISEDGINKFWETMNTNFNRKEDIKYIEEKKLRDLKPFKEDKRRPFAGYMDKESLQEFLRSLFEIRTNLLPYMGTSSADRKAKSTEYYQTVLLKLPSDWVFKWTEYLVQTHGSEDNLDDPLMTLMSWLKARQTINARMVDMRYSEMVKRGMDPDVEDARVDRAKQNKSRQVHALGTGQQMENPYKQIRDMVRKYTKFCVLCETPNHHYTDRCPKINDKRAVPPSEVYNRIYTYGWCSKCLKPNCADMKMCKKGQVCGIENCQLPHHPYIHPFRSSYKDHKTFMKQQPAPPHGKFAAIQAATKASWANKNQVKGYQAHNVAVEEENPATVAQEVVGNAGDDESGTDLATADQQ